MEVGKRKEYMKKYMKEYQEKNKDRLKKYYRKYYLENKNKKNRQSKKYYKENREKINKWNRGWKKERRLNNPMYRLNHSMGTSMRIALKGNKKGRHWEDLVDYTLIDLIERLESLFTKGMTWEKLLKGEIQIDHLIPKTNFNYNNTEDKEFKKCWALENLQPLWAKDNKEKSDKISVKYNNIGI